MINLIIHEFRRSLSGKIVCLGLILMPEIMLLIGINGVKRSEFDTGPYPEKAKGHPVSAGERNSLDRKSVV